MATPEDNPRCVIHGAWSTWSQFSRCHMVTPDPPGHDGPPVPPGHDFPPDSPEHYIPPGSTEQDIPGATATARRLELERAATPHRSTTRTSALGRQAKLGKTIFLLQNCNDLDLLYFHPGDALVVIAKVVQAELLSPLTIPSTTRWTST